MIIKLKHMYDDWDLYQAVTQRTPSVIRGESMEIAAAIGYAMRHVKGFVDTDLRAMEVFCGTGGSLYVPHLKKMVPDLTVAVQLDLLKTPATPPSVTIGDVLTYRDPKPFDLIFNGWDNIELLPHGSATDYVLNMLDQLTPNGVFLERAWAGLGQEAMTPGPMNYEQNVSARSGLGRKFPGAKKLRIGINLLNNLLEAQFWYEKLELIDANHKVLASYKIENPVVLTNASAYDTVLAARRSGFKCEPLFLDENDRATVIQPAGVLPSFFCFSHL